MTVPDEVYSSESNSLETLMVQSPRILSGSSCIRDIYTMV